MHIFKSYTLAYKKLCLLKFIIRQNLIFNIIIKKCFIKILEKFASFSKNENSRFRHFHLEILESFLIQILYQIYIPNPKLLYQILNTHSFTRWLLHYKTSTLLFTQVEFPLNKLLNTQIYLCISSRFFLYMSHRALTFIHFGLRVRAERLGSQKQKLLRKSRLGNAHHNTARGKLCLFQLFIFRAGKASVENPQP